jgi:aminopeptidase N
MEYPMFVMDGYTNAELPGDVFRTNDHEHGHEWFPMIVGSNERRYAWMDEGINTYINAFSQERRYGSDPTQWPRGMSNFFAFLGDWYAANKAGIDNPLMNRPDHFADQDVLGVEGYQKPGAVLLALRDHVVGAESMDRAMREYVHRWAFKHPTPGDFFRTVENVAGKDLSWFWRSFFYTTDVLDIGIDSVNTKPADDGRLIASVQLQRHTSVVFPVELRLALADGSTKDITLPVDIWSRGMTFTAEIPVSAEVKGARLWPDRSSIPDMNPKNDTWGTPPAGDPPHPATVGGLAPVFSAR